MGERKGATNIPGEPVFCRTCYADGTKDGEKKETFRGGGSYVGPLQQKAILPRKKNQETKAETAPSAMPLRRGTRREGGTITSRHRP